MSEQWQYQVRIDVRNEHAEALRSRPDDAAVARIPGLDRVVEARAHPRPEPPQPARVPRDSPLAVDLQDAAELADVLKREERRHHGKKDNTDHKTSGYFKPYIRRSAQQFKLALLLGVSSC